MLLSDAIAELRAELSDPVTTANPQGKRYSNALFTKWINAGVALAYAYRKDLFMETSVVKATAGDIQKPCGFDKIHKIDGITDACGNMVKPLKRTSSNMAGIFSKRKCSPCTIKTVVNGLLTEVCTPVLPDSYAIDQANQGVFTVTPAVPAGTDVFYRITGAVTPKPFDADLAEQQCFPPAIQIPALHYARYMAWLTETESATSRALATEQLGIFFRLLKIYKDSDKEFAMSFVKDSK
jgi:hypothetical protein